MSTTTPPRPATAAIHRGPTWSVTRILLVASPVLAGAFAVLGTAADPAVGLDGPELYALYSAEVDRVQLKSLGLHWSYAFLVLPALLVPAYVHGRGRVLAGLGLLLGFVGISTLPGLLFIDYYDSAIGRIHGAEGVDEVVRLMDQMWAVPVFVVPGMLGAALALPVCVLALWRAGLVRWWAPVAVLAGLVAFGQSGPAWWGALLTTVCFAVVAVELARATAPAREHAA